MRKTLLLILLLFVTGLSGCGDSRPTPRSNQAYNDFATQFTRSLGRRDYAAAHAMLAPSYAARVSAAQLQADFEELVPRSVNVTQVEAVDEPLTEWPDMAPEQTAMVYVSIEGTGIEEFEAITVYLSDENGQQKVYDIEYGRAD